MNESQCLFGFSLTFLSFGFGLLLPNLFCFSSLPSSMLVRPLFLSPVAPRLFFCNKT
jgi:hypothetical protein